MPRLKTPPPISSTDAIRACKTEHPDWKPKQIVEALKLAGAHDQYESSQ